MRQLFETNLQLGILKGGQLGRMLLRPCMDLGVVPHIMDSDPDAPAFTYLKHHQVGDALSFDDVYNFGKALDLVTLEFEHVNLAALRKLEEDGVKVYPQPDLIEIVQDKGLQKNFYAKAGLPTAEFQLIDNRDQLKSHLDQGAIVQKKRTAGYDGQGVVVLRSPDDINKAFDEPSVIEKQVTIDKEISVLVARNADGQMATYPPVEMVFHQQANMLDYLFAPANIAAQHKTAATDLAIILAEKLNLIGILAVEMFITPDQKILINEIAPRPHNSGHHTIEANQTSQFQQHIRAILNLPLGSTEAYAPAVMLNIVGEPDSNGPVMYEGLRKFLKIPGVHIHLYGKKITRPYRKMGHITIVKSDLNEALAIAQHIKAEVKARSCQT